MKILKRIVFMGTPDFAATSLKAIVNAGFNVVGVITAPDKPAGRGQRIKESEVKQYAKTLDVKVLQPKNLKDETFLQELKKLEADINVVVAFRMLPEVVWNMPPLGSVNLHGSLLPNYRGAAPIHWAVINGEPETGVSTFFLKHKIDTGNIIEQAKIPIGKNDTTGDVYERLMHLGATLIVDTLKKIEQGSYTETPQEMQADIKHAPKLFKKDGLINWAHSAQAIHNKVRGLNPFPTAYTSWKGKTIKIHETRITEGFVEALNPGKILVDGKKLYVGTGTTPLEINILQMQGKKRSNATDFINAYHSDLDEAYFKG